MSVGDRGGRDPPVGFNTAGWVTGRDSILKPGASADWPWEEGHVATLSLLPRRTAGVVCI